MNELILSIENFKQQLAYSINNAKLPAEVIKMVLSEYLQILAQASATQLAQAKATKEEDDNGTAN